MNASLLIEEEQSYVLGLYLADGSLEGKRYSRVSYSLQQNEAGIAARIAALLTRTHLKPKIYKRRSRNRKGHFILVQAESMNLREFFPDKKALLEDERSLQMFLEEHNLTLGSRNAIAFIAGLIDGDGSCRARRYRSATNVNGSFGRIRADWSFSQVRYPLLLDVIEKLVGFLAACSTSRFCRGGKVEGVHIKRSAREALLQVGIGEWCWKARDFADTMSQLVKAREKEKEEYVGSLEAVGIRLVDAARMLSVPRTTLHYWCSTGKLKARVVQVGRQRHLLITKHDLNKLEREIDEAKRIENEGIGLMSAAKILIIPSRTPRLLLLWKDSCDTGSEEISSRIFSHTESRD